ncbi:SprT-like family-domain-containing protein [Annulohypoxylon bovei var. microspora]|nr:SprT-like family-domain-containing protein [Annulohypoxylon bovei var. microspora]
MADALDGSSDDEFPDVNVVVRQYRQKVKGRQEEGDLDGEEVNTQETIKSTSRNVREVKNTPAVKATPLRRRKLGQRQTTDESLLKPWGKTVTIKEEKSRAPDPKGPRARVRVKEEVTEAGSSSKDALEPMPTRARQPGSRTVSSNANPNPISKKPEKLQTDDDVKNTKGKRRLVSRKEAKKSMPSDESSEESDAFKDIRESSEEEESEFISESDSETDAWDSGSERSATPPTRRSRSPTIEWAKPQRTLFRDPDKKAAPSNKQPQATVTEPTNRLPKQRGVLKTTKPPQPGNLEDAFQKLQIFNSDSEPDEPRAKGDKKPILEPVTPRKTLKALPASPLKTPKIPMSPWKPEHKEFWDSEVHFGWIDKHSPEKKLLESAQKGKGKAKAAPPATAAQDLKAEAKLRYGVSPEKRDARKAFDAGKEALARAFLQELDERVTDGRLAQLTRDTGGLRIAWSNSLLTTAGRAHWKCKTQATLTKSADGSTVSRRETRQHHASIELASKVLCNEPDLLNTVAHEFCHLAVFILNGKPKAAHGPEFKAWGARCGRAFADRGIAVTTKHNYEIEYKYIWECAGCRAQIKRHSRSVDVVRQRCGACRGTLRQVKPPPRGVGGGVSTPTGAADVGGSGKDGPATVKRKQSAYNEFSGKEMKALSQSNPGMSFKDKMAIVSAKWAEVQRLQKQEKGQKDEKRGKAMKELRTAVEVLKIDDDEGEEYGVAEDQPKATAKSTGTYDIFS